MQIPPEADLPNVISRQLLIRSGQGTLSFSCNYFFLIEIRVSKDENISRALFSSFGHLQSVSQWFSNFVRYLILVFFLLCCRHQSRARVQIRRSAKRAYHFSPDVQPYFGTVRRALARTTGWSVRPKEQTRERRRPDTPAGCESLVRLAHLSRLRLEPTSKLHGIQSRVSFLRKRNARRRAKDKHPPEAASPPRPGQETSHKSAHVMLGHQLTFTII